MEAVLREAAERPQLPQPALPGRPAQGAQGPVLQVLRQGGEVLSEQARRAAHRKQALTEMSAVCTLAGVKSFCNNFISK